VQIKYLKDFQKHYQKRVAPHANLVEQFRFRLQLLIDDPTHPLLRDHKLIGQKRSYRAFSLTGDFRVVYQIENDVLYLYDVGTHNQVY
jgi:addiction module RelE/StbE family toxin